MLGLLLSFSMVLMVAPKAKAIAPGTSASSMIYGSTILQPAGEVEAGSTVCNYMASLFSDEGYNVTNACYEYTAKGCILEWAYSMEHNYDSVALFHVGNMNDQGHYFDNYGADLSYDDIYPQTVLGKHFFVWMYVCRSADDGVGVGLSPAWTHTTNLSDQGCDSGTHCYIGFSGASPMLSSGSFQFSEVLAQDFVMEFYYYSLSQDYSVINALNSASLDLFATNYENSPLCQGYTTCAPIEWGMEPPWTGRMCLFGNANIYLAAPPEQPRYEVTVLGKDQYGNDVTGEDVSIDGQPSWNNWRQLHHMATGHQYSSGKRPKWLCFPELHLRRSERALTIRW